MGAGASIPEALDRQTCRNLCGEEFDEDVFDQLQRSSGRSDGCVSRSAFEEFLKKTDVFLTHDWGVIDGVDNHKRVSKINAELKKKGITTWFDEEKMEGNIKKQMTRGIDNASVIVVFCTHRYMMKVDGDNANDNCQLEFNYATNRKSADKMVAVVMEERMRNTREWVGELGMVLGSRLYVDCCNSLEDASYLKSVTEQIYDAVIRIIGKPIRGFPKAAKPSVSSSSQSNATSAPAPKPTAAPAVSAAVTSTSATSQSQSKSSRVEKNASNDDEENLALVVDLGSLHYRAGFAGEDAPFCCGTYPNGGDSWMDEGKVIDFNIFEKNLCHIFYNELRNDPSECPVMMTEVPLNPKATRERTTQLMFEAFETQSFYLNNRAVSSLYASGRTTGLVFHSGHKTSYAVPIYEGYALPHAIVKFSHAGMWLSNIISSAQGWNDPSLVHEFKKGGCMMRSRPDADDYAIRDFKLPDGTIVGGTSRCVSAEALWTNGMADVPYASVMKCDVDVRKDLVGDIVLMGGTTMMEGFQDRFQYEMESLFPSNMKVKVVAPPERENSAWIGGSILSSLSTFQEMWITKKEYDEAGPSIVHRKCF